MRVGCRWQAQQRAPGVDTDGEYADVGSRTVVDDLTVIGFGPVVVRRRTGRRVQQVVGHLEGGEVVRGDQCPQGRGVTQAGQAQMVDETVFTEFLHGLEDSCRAENVLGSHRRRQVASGVGHRVVQLQQRDAVDTQS